MTNFIAGINKFLLRVFGSRNERILKTHWPLVPRINEFEGSMKESSDEALEKKTEEFRDRLAGKETLKIDAFEIPKRYIER